MAAKLSKLCYELHVFLSTAHSFYGTSLVSSYLLVSLFLSPWKICKFGSCTYSIYIYIWPSKMAKLCPEQYIFLPQLHSFHGQSRFLVYISAWGLTRNIKIWLICIFMLICIIWLPIWLNYVLNSTISCLQSTVLIKSVSNLCMYLWFWSPWKSVKKVSFAYIQYGYQNVRIMFRNALFMIAAYSLQFSL